MCTTPVLQGAPRERRSRRLEESCWDSPPPFLLNTCGSWSARPRTMKAGKLALLSLAAVLRRADSEPGMDNNRFSAGCGGAEEPFLPVVCCMMVQKRERSSRLSSLDTYGRQESCVLESGRIHHVPPATTPRRTDLVLPLESMIKLALIS